MRYLILQPDWKNTPIEIDYPNGYDNWFALHGTVITPEELELTPQLCTDLWAWADFFDTQMDWDNAPKMLEWTDEQHKIFETQGEQLLLRLREELNEGYEVVRGKWDISKW